MSERPWSDGVLGRLNEAFHPTVAEAALDGERRLVDDLATLIDVCEVVAHRLWHPNPFLRRAEREAALSAVLEAADMSRVLQGGDAVRAPWTALVAVLGPEAPGSRYDGPGTEEAVVRAGELVTRLRAERGR